MKSLRQIVVLAILSLSIAAAQVRKGPLKPVIRQVDHILIQSDDPKALFEFFSGTLQLPVAWPLSEYQGYISGGVSAGNANLEVLRLAGRVIPAQSRHGSARFMGLALEPMDFAESLIQMKARRIGFDPPVPYVSKLPDGSDGTLWTNATLSGISKPGLTVFLCEYSPAFLNVAIRRNQLGGQLALRQGGPLGIKSVKEIVIASNEFAPDKAAWQDLLMQPTQPDAAVWQTGNGPGIHLVPGTARRIVRIILRVNSLGPAKAFLAGKHMLGTVSPGYVSIVPARIQGLDIHLVAK